MTWVHKEHHCELPAVTEGSEGDLWRCATCHELWCIKATWYALIAITTNDTYWARANKRQRAAHPIKESR